MADLLAWHLATGQRERTAGASFTLPAHGSNFHAVAKVAQLGIVGDGNSGTKGTWRGGAVEPSECWAPTIDQRVTIRMARLGELRCVADTIIEDSHGDRIVDVELYRDAERPKTQALSLPQRIGWALASEKQRAQWRVKIAKRDSAPALAGMEQAGALALQALCTRWDEMAAEEQRAEIAAECRREAGVE